jgi:hypothetical protein
MLGLLKVAAILQSLLPVSSTQANVAPWEHPEVVKVDCQAVVGTAFRVGPSTLLSVAHVTHNMGCRIDGKPFHVVRTTGDFSILSTAQADGRWLKVNCGGFVKGRKYEAIGFARGKDTQTTVADLEATGESVRGLYLLTGVFTVIPGMSGGPIIDAETGDVVGTTNTFEPMLGVSGSVELKHTSVCA